MLVLVVSKICTGTYLSGMAREGSERGDERIVG